MHYHLSIKKKAKVPQYLNVAEVVSCVAAEARMDQHGVQTVHLRLALALGHEGPHVKVLWVPHVLENEKKHTRLETLALTRVKGRTDGGLTPPRPQPGVGFHDGRPPW